MPHAADAIRALLRSGASPRRFPHAIVGITGPVGAGKSTLAKALSGCVIATDDYLPDYHLTPEHLRDLPESSDLSRLLDDLNTLRQGHSARVPRWSFQTHSRIGERVLTPAPGALIVVEGLHALHHAHADAIDVRVYVDAPATLRWSRWERLETSGERAWGVEYARRFFDRVAEPTFSKYAAAYRQSAHVLVNNPG